MPRNMRKGLYRVIYLVKGQRAAVPATLQFDAAMREFARLKRRAFTAWIETDSGEFVPVEGAMRKPKEIVDEQRRHRVADFSTLPELIEHAKTVDGATHILIAGRSVKIYFPTSEGRYEERVVWQQNGYWHAPAPSDRSVVTRLPVGTEPIGSHTQRVGRRATEARGEVTWVPPALAAEGITPIMLEIVLDGVGEHAKIRPGKNVVIDRAYAALREAGYIVVKQATPGLSSFGDYYVLTDKGADLVRRWRMEMRKVGAAREAPANRRRREPTGTSITGALQLANELSQQLNGSTPKPIPGGFRWSELNESAQFTTYSPEYQAKVVIVVSSFDDASIAVGFFGDEGLSETARYENIGHFNYGTTADIEEMVKDIRWVWETVDGYAASWQDDVEGNPLEEEARRELAEARHIGLEPMSATAFIELLSSMQPADRQTRIRFDPSIAGERGGGSVYVNFINLPPGVGGAGGGAEAENNRASFHIRGFAHDPAVPVAKVKVDQSNNVFRRTVPFRARTGSPEVAARHLSAYLAAVVKTVPPNFTHTTTRERSVRQAPGERAANPRPRSAGFIVIDTKTGEILSDLLTRRADARTAIDDLVRDHGVPSSKPGFVEYRNGSWYRPLGVHQVMLYPGETYSPTTYRP